MNVEDNFPCPGCSWTRAWTINQIGSEGHKTLGQESEKHLPLFPSRYGERRQGNDGRAISLVRGCG